MLSQAPLAAARGQADPAPPSLEAAQRLFYSGRYEAAAAMLMAVRDAQPDDLDAHELLTSALHFQIKRSIGDAPDKGAAFARCAACPELLAAFLRETARGVSLARVRLKAAPNDEAATYLLGKLDLNYVWLHLGTLGRKTGWDQYWEARRSLDAVLKRNPKHVRARVARAWIDYIVDTRMPRGTRWILGGGNKKKGLQTVRDAATADATFFIRAEAVFALWDMQVREKNIADAVVTARLLARDFPDNEEVSRFLETHDPHDPR